jgi:hypothetical protein
MATFDKRVPGEAFSGDDNEALIAELKAQGYKYVVLQGEHIQDGIIDPVSTLPPLGLQTVGQYNNGDCEELAWQRVATRIKTDPRVHYVQERLHVMARIIVRDIFTMERGAPLDAPIHCERLQSPEWRRAVMLAGKILSLDLGPVHGT